MGMNNIEDENYVRSDTGNAEGLSLEQLQALFVPNVDDPNVECTFDRLASPDRTWILVADRGLGKTHVLKLLADLLDRRGDVVIRITAAAGESNVTDTYRSLRSHYPKQQRYLLWQLAILEDIAVHLLLRSLSITRQLGKQERMLINYFRLNQPNALTNEDYWREQYRNGRKFRFWPELILMIPYQQMTFQLKLKPEEEKKKLKRPTVTARKKIVEAWVWQQIHKLQDVAPGKLRRLPNTPYSEILTRSLPGCRSVYVIADGLDQDDPLDHQDMISLITAIKILNNKTKKILEADRTNFKALMALRAITYDKIKPKIPDLTHLHENIEEMNWTTHALQRMMARYVAVHAKHKHLSDNNIRDLLDMVFPSEPIYYFGHKFQDGIRFLLECTERRPREILYLWRRCAAVVGISESAYVTRLSPHSLVNGLKIYGEKILPLDVSLEYQLEYPRLNELFISLNTHRNLITRTPPKKVLEDIVKDFRRSISVKDRPIWLKQDVLEVLYQIGLIGIPAKRKAINFNWPYASYRRDASDTPLKDVKTVVVRPAFWPHMTNIKTETDERRQYMMFLFRKLISLSNDLNDHLQKVLKARRGESSTLQKNIQDEHYLFLYALGFFLAVSDLIREFSGYPEPDDEEICSRVKSKVELVRKLLASTPFFHQEGSDEIIDINVLAKQLGSLIVRQKPSPRSPRISYWSPDEFQKVIQNGSPNISTLPYTLFNRQTSMNTSHFVEFRNELIGNTDALTVLLGDEINSIEKLMNPGEIK